MLQSGGEFHRIQPVYLQSRLEMQKISREKIKSWEKGLTEREKHV